jgi:hypothetical protein
VTPAQVDLARVLVTLPGWRWRAGMLTAQRGPDGAVDDTIRCTRDADDPGGPAAAADREQDAYWTEAGDLPDLTDDATGGVLLAMLASLGRVWTEHDTLRGVVSVEVWATGQDPEVAAAGSTIAEAAARALVALGRCE